MEGVIDSLTRRRFLKDNLNLMQKSSFDSFFLFHPHYLSFYLIFSLYSDVHLKSSWSIVLSKHVLHMTQLLLVILCSNTVSYGSEIHIMFITILGVFCFPLLCVYTFPFFSKKKISPLSYGIKYLKFIRSITKKNPIHTRRIRRK